MSRPPSQGQQPDFGQGVWSPKRGARRAPPLGRKRTLGKYKILGRIADGGYATVYRALDTVEGQRVALKVPRAELITPKLLEWMRTEIRLQAGLDHPNILQLKTADMIDDRLVIAYRLGVESLADRMRRRMGVATVLDYAEQMLEAVAHAHEHNVVHCDIKPDNFVLFAGNLLRLTDFSISKMTRRTVAGSGSGTIGYVAPEQAMGKTSFRADVFSLGLLLYQMLAGALPEYPFRWPPPGLARLQRKVPTEFTAFVRRALEVEPTRRYRNAGEMLAAFQRILPRVRRHMTGTRTKRATRPATTRNATQARTDWQSVRFRQFRRGYGKALELKHTCRKCDGPIAESMSACPWCGNALKFARVETAMPKRCKRCKRGAKLDWKFCAWCYGPGFDEVSERSYTDRRYSARCHEAACRGPLMPFMRYCPWCRRKVRKPWKIEGVRTQCPKCSWGMVTPFWEHCAWCSHSPPKR